MMKKISLIVGETASLPKEIVEKYEMTIVPYVIYWKEGKDLPGENIFQKMREAEKRKIDTFPKTSQPSSFVFKKIFEKELERSENILCITLSSKLSGGFNSAFQARAMFDEKKQNRIFVFDSLNVTAGEGLFDIKAAELIKEGKEIGEILKELKNFLPEVHIFGMVQSPKWLEAGGRISHSLAVLISKMQKIGMKPLIGLKNGVIKAVSLKMRARDIPLALFKELKKQTRGKEIKVAIAHGDDLKSAQKLKQMIKEQIKEAEVSFLNLIDPIIGIHLGPGTLLCAWHKV